MKIDIERKYKTREGRPVRIYATDGCRPLCIHGAIKTPSGCWRMMKWNESGAPTEAFGSYESDDALVEISIADEICHLVPWDSLKPEIRWVAMDKDGKWFGYYNEPTSAHPPFWTEYGVAGTCRLDHAVRMPNVNYNRWKETLIKRPTEGA